MAIELDFKSVGVTQSEVATISTLRAVDPSPIGIKTPLSLGGAKSLFVMHTELAAQIKDNFRNLLLTNHGERVGLHDFGANLQPLTPELTANEDFQTEAMLRIKTAAAKYMPFLQLLTFKAETVNDANEHVGRIRLRLTYSVPMLNLNDQVMEITLFVI